MELIKNVFNYLLQNPLYAIVIAVCYVAISVVIILLLAKSSKSKTVQTQQPIVEKKPTEVEAVVSTQKATVTESTEQKVEPLKDYVEPEKAEQSKPANEEKNIEQAKAVLETEKKATAPDKKATPPKAEKKPATAKAKKETTAVTAEKESDVSVSTPKKQSVDATTKKETPNEEPKKKTRYNGKWVIWRLLTKSNDGEQVSEETFFFELLASNGEKLLSSEEYLSLAGAQKGIQTHKTNILKNNFRISLTKKGDYIFKLLNGKNTLLCTGENYPTKLRCENAIESTKRFAETAIVDENIQDLLIQLPPEDVEDNVVEPDNGYTGKWIVSSMIGPEGAPVYYFELLASNGEKLLTSEEYITYNGVINGINTHKNNIERNNFRISLTKRGDYIFKILNANEQLLCLGEHYKTRNRCERAVESVKRFAKTATIMDSPSVKKPIVIQ